MPENNEKKECTGAHCKCMNIDGECPNMHAADCTKHNPYLSSPQADTKEKKVLCCSCGKTLANPEWYNCDNCNAGCHRNCVGEITKGSGEYPDEDRYSYCKKCVKSSTPKDEEDYSPQTERIYESAQDHWGTELLHPELFKDFVEAIIQKAESMSLIQGRMEGMHEGRRIGLQEGKEAERERVRKIVEGMKTAYPIDIFSEPWQGWRDDIRELALAKGKDIDNISAHYGRWQENLMKERILSALDTTEDTK